MPPPSPEPRGRRAELAVFAAILCAAWVLKLRHNPALSSGFDGAYLFQIARRVAEGHGLQTTVSLWRQGLSTLPHASSIYPLWPLVLGFFGRLADLRRVATLVPEALYLLDIGLVYLLVVRIGRRLVGERARPFRAIPINLGHVAAALFASAPVLFYATSLPYTEGLAFAVSLGALLFVDAAATARSARATLLFAALAGLFAGLAYLTRFQLVLAIAAVPLALAIGLRARAGGRLAATVALVCALLPLAAEAVYLTTFPTFRLAMLLDPGACHETPELARISMFEPTAAKLSLGWLLERLAGLGVSLDPGSAYSYVHSMGPAVYAPFLVLGLVFAVRGRTAALLSCLASPQAATVLASVLFGVLLTLPAHLTPADFWQKYVFSWRHGLTLLFLTVPALAWLLTRDDSLPRVVGAGLAALSLWSGIGDVLFMLEPRGLMQKGLSEAGAFLSARPGTNALVIDGVPLVALFTENGLYWTGCGDRPEVLQVLHDRLPIDYVLLRPGERDACVSAKWLLPRLTEVKRLGLGLRDYTVYRWTDRPDPAGR
jgi:hypothetical protein